MLRLRTASSPSHDCAAPAFGQRYTSPPASAAVKIAGKQISVDYYAPSMHGRRIMGELVPFGQVWCPGANVATGLTTEADLQIGSLKLPKGDLEHLGDSRRERVDAHREQAERPASSRLRCRGRLRPHEDDGENARRAGRNLPDRIVFERRATRRNAGVDLGNDGGLDPVHRFAQ